MSVKYLVRADIFDTRLAISREDVVSIFDNGLTDSYSVIVLLHNSIIYEYTFSNKTCTCQAQLDHGYPFVSPCYVFSGYNQVQAMSIGSYKVWQLRNSQFPFTLFLNVRDYHGILNVPTLSDIPLKSEFFEQDNDRVRCMATAPMYSIFGTENDYLYIFIHPYYKYGDIFWSDFSEQTIPNCYNYSFFYKGIKKIYAHAEVCLVQDGSNEWYLFDMNHNKKPVLLRELMKSRAPQDFEENDTIMDVLCTGQTTIYILTKCLKVFIMVYNRRSYLYYGSSSVRLREDSLVISEMLKKHVGDRKDYHISMDRTSKDLCFYLTCPNSEKLITDKDKKKTILSPNQQWFQSKIVASLKEITKSSLGKRSHSILNDAISFSDIYLTNTNGLTLCTIDHLEQGNHEYESTPKKRKK
ncbi:hypothetical protein FDP41_007996 [Naegleria fowleri]|uniref:Uncharacterized protein n=1 Tax=Naegleria fowleri TaxID=5763 RepID=A0A6A5CA43_NAEFO|nr:uncharacterized protein FDP41_007996 [Naegleria fowleri]KAF0984081.1 hypothetical protein FDP41_007996 [Naegleria fowleri]